MRLYSAIVLAVLMVVVVTPSEGLFFSNSTSILNRPLSLLTRVTNATTELKSDLKLQARSTLRILKDAARMKQALVTDSLRFLKEAIRERKQQVFGGSARTFEGAPSITAIITNFINTILASIGPTFFSRLLGLSRDLDLVAGNGDAFSYDDLAIDDEATTLMPESTDADDLPTASTLTPESTTEDDLRIATPTPATPAALENPQHDNIYFLFPTPSEKSASTPVNIVAYKNQPVAPIIVSTDSPAVHVTARHRQGQPTPASTLPVSARKPSTSKPSTNSLD